MRIAIDIDDVLADTLNSFIARYGSLYGIKLKRDQFITYNWRDPLGLTHGEFSERFLSMVEDGLFDNLEPMAGAAEAVGKLKNSHDLSAVTSRPIFLAGVTEKWLEKHFGSAFGNVFYTRDVPFGPEIKSKYRICQEIKAAVLVEDYFEFAADCAANGIKVYLFDAPWNRAIAKQKNVTRVGSWPELMEKLGSKRL